MSYNLFLDDIRDPWMVGDYIYPFEIKALYRKERWNVVRNYSEFCAFIESNGLPEIISFDHDLADEHYTPQEYWESYEKSKNYQAGKQYKEKTGLDCAKWFIDYIIDGGHELPKMLCHSLNPVGKDNILALFESYKKSKENI